MPSDPVEAGNPVERPAPDRLVLGHQGARMHRQDTQPVAGASDPSAPEPMTGPTESPDSPAAPGRRSDRQPLVTHRPSDLQRHDHGAIGHPDEAAGARLDPTRPRLMPMPQARDGRPTPGPPPAGQAHDLQFGHPQVPALPTGQLEPDGDQRWPDLPRRLTGIPPVMPLGPMAIRDISRAARLAAEQAAI